MQPLQKRISQLQEAVLAAYGRLEIDTKQKQLEELSEEHNSPEIWNNPAYAQEKSKHQAALVAMVQPWQTLKAQVADIAELMSLGDDSLVAEFEGQILAFEAEFAERKKELLFNGPYDDHGAILRITAGVGGTDAQDWAE